MIFNIIVSMEMQIAKFDILFDFLRLSSIEFFLIFTTPTLKTFSAFIDI